ncbi:MAG: entericidin A/B family lipoprotein [Gallionella sp.]
MNIVVFFLAVLFLTGRQTMEGLGKDIKSGGDALEKAATK